MLSTGDFQRERKILSPLLQAGHFLNVLYPVSSESRKWLRSYSRAVHQAIASSVVFSEGNREAETANRPADPSVCPGVRSLRATRGQKITGTRGLTFRYGTARALR